MQNNCNYFYAGRIYQFYLDNKDLLFNGITTDLGFLIPKGNEEVDISTIKKLVIGLIKDEKVSLKCRVLCKKNGWRLSFKLIS